MAKTTKVQRVKIAEFILAKATEKKVALESLLWLGDLIEEFLEFNTEKEGKK